MSVTPSEADLQAKARFIEAYFKDLCARITFLEELHGSNHADEAMLLCCCYIDGLANNLNVDDPSSHRNFVRVLREHGGEVFLTRVHLKHLRNALDRLRGKPAQHALEALQKVSGAMDHELHPEAAVLALLPSNTPDSVRGWLRNQLWRGTLACVAYEQLRCLSVHRLGASGAIIFSNTQLDGNPVPPIDFAVLYRVLWRVFEVAHDRSIRSNRWFGHDFRAAEPRNAQTEDGEST